jgi:hypothetical protein
MWLWIGVGLGSFFALSILVAVALAAMLGSIGSGVAELHDGLIETGPPPLARRPQGRRRRLLRGPLGGVTAHSLFELEHP